MLLKIIQIIWFYLPIGLANLFPVLIKKVSFLDSPMDFGLYFKNRPILGKNKTWRGFIFGILAGILTVYFQVLVGPITKVISLIDYSQVNFLLLGFLMGFGALFGDALKSFFKRRLNIAPGKSWIPFDHVDSVISGVLFSSLYIFLSWEEILMAMVILSLLHVLVKKILKICNYI